MVVISIGAGLSNEHWRGRGCRSDCAGNGRSWRRRSRLSLVLSDLDSTPTPSESSTSRSAQKPITRSTACLWSSRPWSTPGSRCSNTGSRSVLKNRPRSRRPHYRRPQALEPFGNGPEILCALGRLYPRPRRDVREDPYPMGALACREIGQQAAGAPQRPHALSQRHPLREDTAAEDRIAETQDRRGSWDRLRANAHSRGFLSLTKSLDAHSIRLEAVCASSPENLPHCRLQANDSGQIPTRCSGDSKKALIGGVW